MSRLLVSENKKVAILFRAEDPTKESRKDKNGNVDNTIYAFDLQEKKYLGEITMKAKALVRTDSITIHTGAFTPDGSKFITIVDTTDAGEVIGVADIFDLKWQIVPKLGSDWPQRVSYSRTLKAIVAIYGSGDIVTYDLKTLTKLSSMTTGGGWTRTVSFSHDGLLLAVMKTERVAELTVVDVKFMEVVAVFTGQSEISSFVWSGDSCCLLVAMKGVRHPVQLYLHRPSGGGNRKHNSEQEYLQLLQGQTDIFGKPQEVSFV